MTRDFTGVIIEESLKNNDILRKIKINKTKVEKVTEKHKTPHLKKWTLHRGIQRRCDYVWTGGVTSPAKLVIMAFLKSSMLAHSPLPISHLTFTSTATSVWS